MTPIEVLKMLQVSIDKAALCNANHVLETSEIEAIKQALHIHSVMQAEVSDGAKGAAVGQRSMDTNAEALDLVGCWKCGKGFTTMTELWSHLDRCAEAPPDGHL